MQQEGGSRIHAEMLVGVSAVVIGIAALGVSLYETRLMRAEQRAAVLPIMEIGKSSGPFATDDGGSEYRLRFFAQNAGIGPARVRDVRITVDEKPVAHWGEFIAALAGDRIESDYRYTQSQIGSRTLPPEANVVMLEMNTPSLAQQIDGELERVDIAICYCSVFDECWRTSFGKFGEPEPMASCPRDDASFQQ